MTSDASAFQKADQIAHRFFTKFALVVNDARNVAAEPREDAKIDKWFNLEMPDTDVYKEQLRLYRSISQLSAPPPPLELQVLLTVPELTNNQVLVQHPPNSSRVRVDPTPTHILLERWTLTFDVSGAGSASSSSAGEVTLATVYKHAMSVFRSLYTLLRVLPAWRMCKHPRRRSGTASRSGQMGVLLRVRRVDVFASADTRYLGFDTPLSPSTPPLPTTTHVFEPVTHPMGVFTLAVTYLSAPHFELDTVESLLSSRFLSRDDGPEFTPTLARNAQRESMSGSPGSLPVRTSLPRSPPSSAPSASALPPPVGTGLGLGFGTGATSNIADRFVLPANTNAVASGSRTAFPTTSPRGRNVPGQVQRSVSAQQAPVGSGSAGSIGSSSRLSREEGREGVSSIASRGRRESTGMGRGSDLPSAPGALLIRRPSTTVQPFKSSTLSSGSPSLYSNSPSLRHASPLAGLKLPSLPGRPTAPPSTTSARGNPFRNDAGPSTPAVGGGGGAGMGGIAAFRPGSSPVLPLRPSPPAAFTPSSLSERRFPAAPAGACGDVGSGAVTEPMAAPPRRKRYSSSFGYRYAMAGSDGSAGSGDKGKELERVGGASYLSNNTDDDDISAFVQDIDARKPIGGGFNTRHDHERTLSETGLRMRYGLAGPRQQSQDGGLEEHNRTISEVHTPSLAQEAREAATATDATGQAATRAGVGRVTLESAQGVGAAPTGAMLLSQVAIDERLRELNDKFRTSMGLVARRPSGTGDTGDTSREALTASPTRARARLPGPGPATHIGGGRREPVIRRAATTSGGGGAEPYSIWDNRSAIRRRADSAGSGASGLSELDRARLMYLHDRGVRGSAASIGGASAGSEEVMGKLEMER